MISKKILSPAFLASGLLMASLIVAVPAFAGDAAAGSGLTAACAACHGADGNSMAPTFPKLAGQGEKYLLKQLEDIQKGAAKGGRDVPEMTGQLTSLSQTDLENIAAYYASKDMGLAGSKDDKELLELGAKIYRAGIKEVGVPACIGCHSPTGAGNAPAGFPKLGGQHADYIAKQLRDFRAGAEYTDKGRHNDGDTRIMRSGVARISDKEIDAVANYIAGLH